MGYYPHLVLGIPFERIEALATSLGVPWPHGTDADAYTRAASQAGSSGDRAFYAVTEALNNAVAAHNLPTEVTDGIYSHASGEGRPGIFDDESWYPGLYGFDLHSSYTGRGIAEAQAACIGGSQGYRMTPELLARVDVIRAQIAAEIPIFAEATPSVFYVHW